MSNSSDVNPTYPLKRFVIFMKTKCTNFVFDAYVLQRYKPWCNAEDPLPIIHRYVLPSPLFMIVTNTISTINQLFTSAQHLLLLILGLHVSTDHSVIFRFLMCYKFQGAVHTFGIPIVFTLKLNPCIRVVFALKLNPFMSLVLM